MNTQQPLMSNLVVGKVVLRGGELLSVNIAGQGVIPSGGVEDHLPRGSPVETKNKKGGKK